MGRIKKYKWLLIFLTLSVAFGGVAYAGYNVAVIASSPSDQWHACVSNTGVVRVPTMRLNSYPASCPRSTDTVRSWNASGPSGVNGIDGFTGPSGMNGTDGIDGQGGATGPLGPTGGSGPTGSTGPSGAPGSGGPTYSTYVGLYSLIPTNSGCSQMQLRLKVIPRLGAPSPASPLGPCKSMAKVVGPSGQLGVDSVTADLNAEASFVQFRILLPAGLQDRFGFSGYVRQAGWSNETLSGETDGWYFNAVSPIAPYKCLCTVPYQSAYIFGGTKSLLTSLRLLPEASPDAGADVGLYAYKFAGESLPAPYQLVFPTESQLSLFEVYSVP